MRDQEFIRGHVPMTKGEVRAVVLSKLELAKTSVVYDIGAGTGSVSVEMAKIIDRGMVYAIEQKEEAVELIRQNAEKFQIENIRIIAGKAPECMENLEIPTHAFIGGSSGNLKRILDILVRENPYIRIVITAIALETLSQAVSWLNDSDMDGEIVCIQISKANAVGSYHMMQALNPVYVISFGGKE